MVPVAIPWICGRNGALHAGRLSNNDNIMGVVWLRRRTPMTIPYRSSEVLEVFYWTGFLFQAFLTVSYF